MGLNISSLAYTLIMLMAIGATGYMIGRITIKGVSLGTVGIFVSALVFGHFGVSIPTEVTNLGLLLFIVAVGLTAGATFFKGLKANGPKYVILSISTIFIGAVVVTAIVKISGTNPILVTGMMSGAYTSTPFMAAAKEAVSDSATNAAFIATGYGLVYPIAALCKILYAQSLPGILGVDLEREKKLIALGRKEYSDKELLKRAKLLKMDRQGLFAVCVAAIIGVLVGAVEFKLPSGATFALGITGGPLLVSLIIGHFGKIGPVNMEINPNTADALKEAGLMIFYAGVGTQGGAGALEIITQYGAWLVLFGLLLVFIPALSGLFIGRKVLRIPFLNCLSCNMASMTFTPSMIALSQKTECDDVVAAYAATYPVALVSLVFTGQILLKLLA